LKSRGIALAQLYMGFMYMDGIGVEEDIDVGMDYFHLAGRNTQKSIHF